MTKIIGTGLSGLVGSRIAELLTQYEFEDISRRTGTDISDGQAVLKRISESSSPLVIHLAAKTDVDGCEDEKELADTSLAWKINVEGTRNVVQACEATGKKIIYISTDMVFDGEKPLGEKYSEDDNPHPMNWYATTKYEGEKIVAASKTSWAIFRIAYPYRAKYEKKEYVRKFLSLLEENNEITAVADHYFTPTYIDDFVAGVELIFKNPLQGFYHIVGDEAVSPYNAALIIAREFNLNEELIKQTTRDEYFAEKAIRPFNLSLKNDKIKKLGLKLHSFSEGIDEIKKQLAEQKI